MRTPLLSLCQSVLSLRLCKHPVGMLAGSQSDPCTGERDFNSTHALKAPARALSSPGACHQSACPHQAGRACRPERCICTRCCWDTSSSRTAWTSLWRCRSIPKGWRTVPSPRSAPPPPPPLLPLQACRHPQPLALVHAYASQVHGWDPCSAAGWQADSSRWLLPWLTLR